MADGHGGARQVYRAATASCFSAVPEEDRTRKSCDANSGVADVSKSVLEAIREGDWFFEPDDVAPARFDATRAVPGSAEKLDVLAARAQEGLPLWHVHDRADYDDPRA